MRTRRLTHLMRKLRPVRNSEFSIRYQPGKDLDLAVLIPKKMVPKATRRNALRRKIIHLVKTKKPALSGEIILQVGGPGPFLPALEAMEKIDQLLNSIKSF